MIQIDWKKENIVDFAENILSIKKQNSLNRGVIMGEKKSTAKKKPLISLKFFSDIKGELKKVVWPKPKTVFKNTGIVLICIIISSIFVDSLDFGLTQLLSTIMNIAR